MLVIYIKWDLPNGNGVWGSIDTVLVLVIGHSPCMPVALSWSNSYNRHDGKGKLILHGKKKERLHLFVGISTQVWGEAWEENAKILARLFENWLMGTDQRWALLLMIRTKRQLLWWPWQVRGTQCSSIERQHRFDSFEKATWWHLRTTSEQNLCWPAAFIPLTVVSCGILILVWLSSGQLPLFAGVGL